LRRAIEVDDLYLKGGAYFAHGYVAFIKGSFIEAKDNLIAGLVMTQKTDFAGFLTQAYF
jgi:hypothetical protein